jgi:uncharacterized protein involved in response to NO
MKRLLDAPHRLFFFLAVLQLLAASAWWAWVLAARTQGLPPPLGTGLDAPHVHAFLMIYAFFPLFIFGFLYTAGPRWLHLPAPEPREYVSRGILVGVSGILVHPALAIGPITTTIVVLLLAAGWLWILQDFVALIDASPAPDKLHARLAALALAFGVVGLLAMPVWLATGAPFAASVMETVGLWGLLVPLFATVCHHMIPFFTANVVPFVLPWRPGFALAILVGGSYAHGLLVLSGLDRWLWAVDAPLAIAVFAFAIRWGITQSFASRLLAMLHIGFVWLGVAYLLHAVQSGLAFFADRVALGLAPVHALTIGFLASLAMAMVSRVSCGHSGRMLAADRLTWFAFLLLQAAAILRVAADAWEPAYGTLLIATIVVWLAGFASWAWRYLPYYWQPRVDGKTG